MCTIHIRSDQGISGSMVDCRIHTDENGNLMASEPSASLKESSISKPRINGDVLTFELKDDSETEPTTFEMKLVKEGLCELMIKQESVSLKPIRFVRGS